MDVRSEPQSPPPRSAGTAEFDLTQSQAERLVEQYPDEEYLCPACEQRIPTRMQVRLAKPARYAERLNDVLKCPMPTRNCPKPGRHFNGHLPPLPDRHQADHVCPPCGFIFSPKALTATVMRR